MNDASTIPVTSDPVAEEQLNRCLRAAQEKIVRENAAWEKAFQENLVKTIQEHRKALQANS